MKKVRKTPSGRMSPMVRPARAKSAGAARPVAPWASALASHHVAATSATKHGVPKYAAAQRNPGPTAR